MGKWDREQKAKEDKQQAKLNPKSPSFIQVKQETKTDIIQLHTGEYYCPFCLHKDRINKYLISTKKGYHKGLGKCPECGNQMQFKSLTAAWTPEQFAEWAYQYSASGYWQKVPFSKFNSRLRQIGWLERFWARYRQLKGSDDNESYTEHIEREQREQAVDEGWIQE
jgi:transcription elongation factor Elf1